MIRRLMLSAVAAAAMASPAAAAAYTVTIADMAFGAVPTALRVGDTIEWVNADSFQHLATARDRRFDVDLPPGRHLRTVLERAGAVAFYCRYHPGMTGTLVVAP